MSDTNAMGQLDKHPMKEQSTFGVEIEFVAWDEEHARKKYDEGQPGDFNFDEEGEDDERFVQYYNDIHDICRKSGYSLDEGKAGSTTFGLGLDGKDIDYELPVIELRTCPLPATQKEFDKFEVFLNRIHVYVADNSKAKFTAHTGLHIHVSNPKLQGNVRDGDDILAKLSASVGVDEEQIWNDLASSDRNFGRFALLNHHEDFENVNHAGVHQKIVRTLSDENDHPTSRTYSPQQLAKILDDGRIGRNIGTNFNSRNPTVEYRYLSSILLENYAGVQKVMQYIKYFVNQTLAQTNKNQVKLQYQNHTAIFTRLKGGYIRVDTSTQEQDSDVDRYKPANAPTPNINNADATKIDKYNRPEHMPVKMWQRQNPEAFKNKYTDMSKKTNWKYNVNTKPQRDKRAAEDEELLKSLGVDYQ